MDDWVGSMTRWRASDKLLPFTWQGMGRPGKKWAAAMKPNQLKAISDTFFHCTRKSMSTAQKFPTNC